MKTYLKKRKQYASIAAHNSTDRTIEFGVPQGSILGPLYYFLFTLMIFLYAYKPFPDFMQMTLHCSFLENRCLIYKHQLIWSSLMFLNGCKQIVW